MHMEQRFGQVQTLTQRLMLTQKMQQAIFILQLSGMELEQYVREELETNPVLELVQKDSEAESQEESGDTTASDGTAAEDDDFDLDDFADQWGMRHKEGRDLSFNPESQERRQYYEDSITAEESFTSKLMAQLRVAAQDDETCRIGERLVGDIDGRGYLTVSLDEIAEELSVPLAEVERVHAIIKHFEPTGVGARDVVECLLLQIDLEYPGEDELRVLVGEHLEALERRQIPKIAKAMGIEPERVEELKTMLAKLNPWPGHEFSSEPTQYVTPDIIVEKIDGKYIVYLSEDHTPELRINAYYSKLARDKKAKLKERQYLRGKVESVKWLKRNIEQRRQTILRIGTAIAEIQEEFFDKGVEFIKPLTLQEIADKVGVHEATVSRTTRGKYMQTPQGLFELKYFFSPGLARESGEAQSSKSVQSVIKRIIGEEDKAKPLSDQKIANLLKEQGIKIARRTVTKYREGMGIPTTTLRRAY